MTHTCKEHFFYQPQELKPLLTFCTIISDATNQAPAVSHAFQFFLKKRGVQSYSQVCRKRGIQLRRSFSDCIAITEKIAGLTILVMWIIQRWTAKLKATTKRVFEGRQLSNQRRVLFKFGIERLAWTIIAVENFIKFLYNWTTYLDNCCCYKLPFEY